MERPIESAPARMPPPTGTIPSVAVENYLKAIFSLAGQGAGARVLMGGLARALGVTPGTVTTMVRRLRREGLVTYRRYEGVSLTPRGKKAAVSVVRRHRLIETFLVRSLGLDWAEVHEEAERLEHAISPRVIEALDEFLGRPETDPHGEPIPDARGRLRRRPLVDLSVARVGARLCIAQIDDDTPAFLRFASEHSLRPGARGSVVRRDAGAGVLEWRPSRGRPVIVALGVAGKILVTPE